jgi:hypothetical protein
VSRKSSIKNNRSFTKRLINAHDNFHSILEETRTYIRIYLHALMNIERSTNPIPISYLMEIQKYMKKNFTTVSDPKRIEKLINSYYGKSRFTGLAKYTNPLFYKKLKLTGFDKIHSYNHKNIDVLPYYTTNQEVTRLGIFRYYNNKKRQSNELYYRLMYIDDDRLK